MPPVTRTLRITITDERRKPVVGAVITGLEPPARTNIDGVVTVQITLPITLKVTAVGHEPHEQAFTDRNITKAWSCVLRPARNGAGFQTLALVQSTIAVQLKIPQQPDENTDSDGIRIPQEILNAITQGTERHLLLPQGILILVLQNDSDELVDAKLRSLAANPDVIQTGRVVRFTQTSCTFLKPAVITRFSPRLTPDERQALARKHRLSEPQPLIPALNIFISRYNDVAGREVLTTAQRLAQEPEVIYSEPDLTSTIQTNTTQIRPTNFLFENQWDFHLIKLPEAWGFLNTCDPDKKFGSPQIAIGVLDTVFDRNSIKTHPSFEEKNNIFLNTIAPTNNHSDHGLACASVAAGKTHGSKEIGAAGVAGGCALHLQPVQEQNGTIYLSTFASAIESLIKIGVAVISSSISPDILAGPSNTVDAILNQLQTNRNSKGTLLLQASGNGLDGTGTKSTVDAFEKYLDSTVCLIAASTKKTPTGEGIAPYSNYHSGIFCCAPSGSELEKNRPNIGTIAAVEYLQNGKIIINKNILYAPEKHESKFQPNELYAEFKTTQTGILPTKNPPRQPQQGPLPRGTYGRAKYRWKFSGTSYSTPVVAGVAALMLSANPSLTYKQIRQFIADTAVQPTGLPNTTKPSSTITLTDSTRPHSHYSGYGRIDAEQAVKAAAVVVSSPAQVLAGTIIEIKFTAQTHWATSFALTLPPNCPLTPSAPFDIPAPNDRPNKNPDDPCVVQFSLTKLPSTLTASSPQNFSVSIKDRLTNREWTVQVSIPQPKKGPSRHMTKKTKVHLKNLGLTDASRDLNPDDPETVNRLVLKLWEGMKPELEGFLRNEMREYGLRRMQNHLVEEMLQTVYQNVLENIYTDKPLPANHEGWSSYLYTIAHRKICALIREYERKVKVGGETAAGEGPQNDRAPLNEVPSPDSDENSIVSEVLEGFTHNEQVLLRTFWHDKPRKHAEFCKQHGIKLADLDFLRNRFELLLKELKKKRDSRLL